MKVQIAEQDDIKGWLDLASEVEHLFGPMVSDPNFIRALQNNINRQSAFCIRENDGTSGSRLLGGILFSSSNAPSYKIGWLSVSSDARNKGIASALLQHVLALIDIPAEISVITFGDDITDDLPARMLYKKFGFVPQNEPIPEGIKGGSRQKFKLVIIDKNNLVQLSF